MSVQLHSKFNTGQPYHLYMDLDVLNNTLDTTTAPVQFSFQTTRSSPFLNCPENYFCSIVRFSLQNCSTPIWIPQVLIGQSDVNKLIYTITMVYMGISFTYNVEYIPSDSTISPPITPITAQGIDTSYYFVYTYQQFIDIFNSALKTCFNALAGLTSLPTANAPFFTFDVDTSLMTLNADKTGFDQGAPNPIYIYANSRTQSLFSSFPTNTTSLGTYFVIADRYGTNTYAVTDPSYTAIQAYQETTSINILNPVRSLVFTTTLLPIVNELTNPPKIFGSESTLFSQEQNNDQTPIITDFIVNVENANSYRNGIVYEPTAEYFLIDMIGSSPCSSLQLKIFWKDNFNILHPFLVNAGTGGNMRLMFRRKDYNIQKLFNVV